MKDQNQIPDGESKKTSGIEVLTFSLNLLSNPILLFVNVLTINVVIMN